jgi:hypothetical protein
LNCLTQHIPRIHKIGGIALFLRCASKKEIQCLREDERSDLNSIEIL